MPDLKSRPNEVSLGADGEEKLLVLQGAESLDFVPVAIKESTDAMLACRQHITHGISEVFEATGAVGGQVDGTCGGAFAVAADVDGDVFREGEGEAGRGRLLLLLPLGLSLLLLGFARGTHHMLLLLLLLLVGGGGEGGCRKGRDGGGDGVAGSSVEEVGEALGQVHALRLVLHAKAHPNGHCSDHDDERVGFQEHQEGGRGRGGGGEGGEQGIVVVVSVGVGLWDRDPGFHGFSCWRGRGGPPAGHGVLFVVAEALWVLSVARGMWVGACRVCHAAWGA